MNFDYGVSSDIDRIQDSDWASVRYRMTLSQINAMFDLTDEEYKKLQNSYPYGGFDNLSNEDWFAEETEQTNLNTI